MKKFKLNAKGSAIHLYVYIESGEFEGIFHQSYIFVGWQEDGPTHTQSNRIVESFAKLMKTNIIIPKE